MARFLCHDFSVTKRFRLERIVRPQGGLATSATTKFMVGLCGKATAMQMEQ